MGEQYIDYNPLSKSRVVSCIQMGKKVDSTLQCCLSPHAKNLLNMPPKTNKTNHTLAQVSKSNARLISVSNDNK
jgi:hypothetical protein